ncbi:MAG TPA: hypothetical protein VGB19_05250 [Actinomycetota bacterium]
MLLDSRRFIASVLAVGVIATACTSGKGPGASSKPPPNPNSIRALREGATEISLLGGVGERPVDAIQTGKSFFIFDLAPGPGQIIQGGQPKLYLARGENSDVRGPFTATWSPFTGYEKTGDTSPKSLIPGVYWTQVDVPSPGVWTVAVTAENDGGPVIGVAHAYAKDDVVAAVGSKALSVKTPVATTPEQAAKIDTRVPPSPMHYISLDEALANGKPTVVSFATPLLCESRLCGPVVDEQLLVFRKVGADRANFIHVEEFPDRDPTKPAPAFTAWGFRTEPWVIVIDSKGIIRARFEGPATAQMIETALDPLLS